MRRAALAHGTVVSGRATCAARRLLVGAGSGSDLVVWGGSWASGRDLQKADTTSLPGGEPTTGLLAADLAGDPRPDLLRLGYGGREPSPDLVLVQQADREFEVVELPNSRRRSRAAEIADVDGDDRSTSG